MEPEADERTTFQQTPSPSPPQAAKPVIASTILENLLRQRHRSDRIRERQQGGGDAAGSGSGSGQTWRRDGAAAAVAAVDAMGKVRSGFKELDDYVLMGGIERGTVAGISGDGEGGGMGRLIPLHLLITVLLSNPFAKASIIDTTGSFPVPLLAQIIRLRASSQLKEARHTSKSDIGRVLDEIVQSILGRVAISRAFDIEGVWEVLSEISANCRSNSSASEALDLDEEEIESLLSTPNPALHKELSKSPELVRREDKQELEIDDSEAEDEGSDLDDEVEAEISQSGKLDLEQHDIDNSNSPGLCPTPTELAVGLKPSESNGRIEIILIDNMATPINELFSRREKSFAHTLLTTFSRTLHNLSQTHSILTILLNILAYPSDNKKYSTSRPHTKPISIFAATTARPALGRLFSDLCALHLLITMAPKTADDAQALYVSPPIESSPNSNSDDAVEEQLPSAQRQPTKPEIQYAHVIEIIKDTVHNIDSYDVNYLHLHLNFFQNPYSRQQQQQQQHDSTISTSTSNRLKRKRKRSRCQRWAPFTISADGLELQNAFGHRTEPSAPVHVMHLVKQFPFGRRI